MIETIIDFLLKAQNPDGGWGAAKGKRSNTEATSLALLGLSTWADAVPARRISHGLTWLTTQQHADGSWPPMAWLQEGSWATALAILALAFFESYRQSALRGANWLLHLQGRRPGWMVSLLYRFAPQKLPIRVNPHLQGWPWAAAASSWVEPTAYSLIALKRLRASLQETLVEKRIRQGERMLYDRMCVDGGWNSGNVQVYGELIPPYPDTTALALIALHDHQAAEANQRSLQALRNMLTDVESGLALSWSILCFALYGHDVSTWQALLTSNYEKRGFLGETSTLAVALLALGDGTRRLSEN